MKRMFSVASIAVATALGLVLGGALATAQPANYVGYELRGNLPGQETHRDNHLWRFHRNGRLNGVYTTLSFDVRGGEYVSESDRGSWRTNGGQLCVTWTLWFQGEEQCYRVTRLNGRWFNFVRTDGSYSFRGTLARSG
jgi:hypothetical protein